jgi:hypothetical protein
MFWEASLGNRSVHFYPETSYWVNVDVDVPLALYVYGQRRVHDMRLIAREEDRRGVRIDGVMNFDSGWEWGYWLNDAMLAAASWDPLGGTAADDDKAYATYLLKLFAPLDKELRVALADWLMRYSEAQHQLMLLGG